MNPSNIPQHVLFDELRRVVGARRVRAAVFLTFQFDPEFFETELLPVLFDQSFSHAAPVRLMQLEEALREVQAIAVYYDARALTPDAKPARLDYARIGLTRTTGYFHPKNIFLLVRDTETETDSLIFATLSSNLTRAGWWENVEVAHIEEIKAGAPSSLREDLMSLLNRIKNEDRMSSDHTALERIHEFVRYQTMRATKRIRNGLWMPQLYRWQESIPEFLSRFQLEEYNLEVISPYFDDTAEATTLRALIDQLTPKETRVYLPQGKDGAALCHQPFFESVERLHGVRWGRLPTDVVRLAQQDKALLNERFVHAKVYRFWNREREILFVGSANLTNAAHQSVRGGNFETGILVETENPERPGWWLEPLTTRPEIFRAEASEGVLPKQFIPHVALEFDWADKTLHYFWELSENLRPNHAIVMSQGVEQFQIVPVHLNKWHELGPDAAKVIETLLKSTSFVEIEGQGFDPFRILIRERGMAHKPSLLMSLSAQDILEYWSLLTSEQREAFIAQRLPQLAQESDLTAIVPTAEQVESMFDRFAGIFYAFGQLERHVRRALDEGREAEGVYRLLGEKYDSMPSLIQRVRDEDQGDCVIRYVTLLAAQSTLTRIARDYTEFSRKHRTEFQRVQKNLSYIETLRSQFDFGTPNERKQFFDWYETMFKQEMGELVPEETE